MSQNPGKQPLESCRTQSLFANPSYTFFILIKNAKTTDIMLICVAGLFTIISGIWLPTYSWIFASYIEFLFKIREVTPSQTDFSVILATLILAGFAVITSFLLSKILIFIVAKRQVTSIRKKYFDILMADSLCGIFPSISSQELVTRLEECCKLIFKALGPSMANFSWTLSSILNALVASIYWNWRLSLFFIVLSPFVFVGFNVFKDMISGSSPSFSKFYSKADCTVREILSNIKSVVALGGEYKELERYKQKLLEVEGNMSSRFIWESLALGGTSFLFYISFPLILYVAKFIQTDYSSVVYYEWANVISVAFCVSASTSIVHCAAPCLKAFSKANTILLDLLDTIELKPSNQIDPGFDDFGKYISNLEREKLLINTSDSNFSTKSTESSISKTKLEIGRQDGQGDHGKFGLFCKMAQENLKLFNLVDSHLESVGPLIGKIELQNVTLMSQPTHSEPIFQNLSLEIHANTTVALVIKDNDPKAWTEGFFNLLQGTQRPKTGFVAIENKNLQSLSKNWLRKTVMEISDEPLILPLTLRENLTLLNPNFSDEEIISKVEAIGLDGLFPSLKERLDIAVGYDGLHLTQQEKQLVGIIRAQLFDPKLLLVDGKIFKGPNSQRVAKALQAMSKCRTMIIVCPPMIRIRGIHKTFTVTHNIVEEYINNDKDYSLVDGRNTKWVINADDDIVVSGGFEFYNNCVSKVPRASCIEIKVELANEDDEYAPFTEKINPEDLRELNEALENYEESIIINPKMNSLIDYHKRLWQMVQAQGGAFFYALLPIIVNSVLIPLVLILVSKLTILIIASSGLTTAKRIQRTFSEIILITLIIFGCQMVGLSKLMWFKLRNSNIIRKQLFFKILRMHLAWHEDPKNSQDILARRLRDDADQAINIISMNQSLSIQLVLNIVVAMLMTIFTSPKLGSITLFLLLTLALAYGTVRILKRKYKSQYSESSNTIKHLIIEGLKNIPIIQKLPNQQIFPKLTENITDKAMSARIQMYLCTEILKALGFLALFINLGLIATSGLLMHLEGRITVEKVIVCLLIPIFTLFELLKSRLLMMNTKKTSQSCENICEYFDTQSLIDIEDRKGVYYGEIKGEIEFRNVTFTYPGRRFPVLKDLSFKISQNKQILILGDQKSGKEAISQLLLRLYDVDSGEVLVDGVNIKYYKLHYLRKKIGVIFSEPYIFEGTADQNIKYAEGYAHRDDIREISKKIDEFNLKEVGWLQSDPEPGITEFSGTLIKELNYNEKMILNKELISAEQKHRIGIARVLLRKPSIIFIENLQCQLGNESYVKLQENIKKLFDGVTGLIILDNQDLDQFEDGNKIKLREGKLIETKSPSKNPIRKELLLDF